MSDVPARYSAFISYARGDERSARWLQRRIEAYRLPRSLRGGGPGRLPPVFRDRDELSASPDLEAALSAALAGSAWLIVVCTPAAAASSWVAREIAMFRELRGPDRILTALFAGDTDTAFVDILRSADGEAPLAADFRPHGDGHRLGALKLIARLAGVRLDDLVHRDSGRRARRFGFAALAAALLAVGMAALALVAVRAQAAAEVQRNKAEGFVEFMLTDLRKQLKGVGKLDLLTAVNKRALAYYDGMDLARLPPDSLERRAALLHAMGEDDEKRGNLALATSQWEEARRTTAALLAAAPGDAKRVFAHSQSEYWVGFAAWRSGDLRRAKAAFLTYARLTQELRKIDPTNLDYIMEQGYAFSNLGTFTLRALGQARTAERQFRVALTAFSKVNEAKAQDADVLLQIADGYGWLADSQRLQDRLVDAKANRYFQASQIARLLVLEPNNVEWQEANIYAAIGRARVELAAYKPDAALEILAQVRADAARIALADRENVEIHEARQIVEVITTDAMLMRDGPRADVIARTNNCSGLAPRINDEVNAWCRLQRARLVPNESKGLKLAVARDMSDESGRYSRKWGLDFIAGPK